MNKTYIGIDIGKDGAICKLRFNELGGIDIGIKKMPLIKTELDIHELNKIIVNLSEGNEAFVLFEKLGVIFGSSKNTAFSMGNQAGAVEALCIANGIPYQKVRAVDWQKEMFQGVETITKPGKPNTKDTKAMALVAAKRLFPNLPLAFKEGNKPHDGLIDALLIALYGHRKRL